MSLSGWVFFLWIKHKCVRKNSRILKNIMRNIKATIWHGTMLQTHYIQKQETKLKYGIAFTCIERKSARKSEFSCINSCFFTSYASTWICNQVIRIYSIRFKFQKCITSYNHFVIIIVILFSTPSSTLPSFFLLKLVSK